MLFEPIKTIWTEVWVKLKSIWIEVWVKLKTIWTRVWGKEQLPKIPEPTEEDLWKGKRRRVFFRAGRRHFGGHNMPKKQSCERCGSNSKRTRKTITGAFYWCRTDGEFLVVGYK